LIFKSQTKVLEKILVFEINSIYLKKNKFDYFSPTSKKIYLHRVVAISKNLEKLSSQKQLFR
jgi:hypothetical protein